MVTGHVFALHGGVAHLACDDILVPMDAGGNVADSWRTLLAHLPLKTGPYGLALAMGRPFGKAGNRVVQLKGAPEGGPRLWAVDVGGGRSSGAEWLVQGVQAFLDEVGKCRAPPVHGRARRLVALPLVGAGAGGFAERRDEVIRALLPELASGAARHGYDVALVLGRRSDYAAVQAVRMAERSPLPDSQEERAQDLARRAASGELVLFLGAGVSMGAGLPSWGELLDQLGEKAGFGEGERKALKGLPAPDAADLLMAQLGREQLVAFLQARFSAPRHSLSHGLLASLRVQQAVTTNYDELYERAVEGPLDAGKIRVLPRERASSDLPWVLKLHGDVRTPERVVLTREHYVRFHDTGAPLTAVVQALLLTRHVLFVGYSLNDDTFIRLAHQVRQVLLQGQGLQSNERVGTALALTPEPLKHRLWEQDLHHLVVGEEGSSIPDAARRLEIFLDRVATLACREPSFLLDPRYAGLLTPAETRLAESLRALAETLPTQEEGSRAHEEVRALLARLGASLRR